MHNHKTLFLIGNVILGIALSLFFIPPFWSELGGWAMVVWMILVSIGVYLITRDKGPSKTMPD
ncbi:MAG: hypothetical protein FJ210_03730 [Betaproteobacteria bacterium]|nr:hypothetical protein [Betaproteobacteria bacterium]